MAGRYAHFTKTGLSVSDTATTRMQVSAPSNQDIKIKDILITFDGTAATDNKIPVTIERQTGGSGDTVAAVKRDSESGDIRTTCISDVSSESSAAKLEDQTLIHPQAGYRVPGTIFLRQGEKLGIKLGGQSSQTHNANIKIITEE